MKQDDFEIEWTDSGYESKLLPRPEYPHGCDIDLSHGAALTCGVLLPYPAKRCGLYTIRCTACGMTVAVTTAGRKDDPRCVKIGCKPVERVSDDPRRAHRRKQTRRQ